MFHSDQISNIFRFYSCRNKQDNKLCFSNISGFWLYDETKSSSIPAKYKIVFFHITWFPHKKWKL